MVFALWAGFEHSIIWSFKYGPNTPTGFKLYRATVEDIIIDIYFYHLNHSFNLSASTPFK